jgi:hypothetical protein
VESEIQMMARVLLPMTHTTAMAGSGRVMSLLEEMQTAGKSGLTGWGALAQETKELADTIGPLPPIHSRKKTGVLEKVRFWSR